MPLLYTLEQGIHTGDFGRYKSKPALKQPTQFAEAIIGNFGQGNHKWIQNLLLPQYAGQRLPIFKLDKKSDDGIEGNGKWKRLPV